MPDEQCWENCKYSFPIDKKLSKRLKLSEHGFHEFYCCTSQELSKSNIYPKIKTRHKGELLLLLDLDRGKFLALSSSLEPYINPKGIYFGVLQGIVETELRACRHCKFYELL